MSTCELRDTSVFQCNKPTRGFGINNKKYMFEKMKE